jgi:hypothetical protein
MTSGVMFLFSSVGATQTVIESKAMAPNTYVLLTIICGIIACIGVLIPYTISGTESSLNLRLLSWCMVSPMCNPDCRPPGIAYEAVSAVDDSFGFDDDADDCSQELQSPNGREVGAPLEMHQLSLGERGKMKPMEIAV